MRKTAEPIKQRCRELFFKYRTTKEICAEMKVNADTLNNWIYGRAEDPSGGWQDQRAIESGRFIKEVCERNTQSAHTLVSMGFSLLQQSMMALSKRTKEDGSPRPLSAYEAKAVSDIITSVDKLLRLAAEQPTEIIGEQRLAPVTIEELREAILKDRFIDIIPMLPEAKDDSSGSKSNQAGGVRNGRPGQSGQLPDQLSDPKPGERGADDHSSQKPGAKRVRDPFTDD